MHIPDGFLDPVTAGLTYLILILYGFFALRRVRKILTPEVVSLSSVLAAGVFAAQMLNWPLPGGTSLHFVGGALTGIIVGPWLGFLTMFLVLLIQCLVFHDGGITALGANAINMAIIDVLIGYLVYQLFTSKSHPSNSNKALGASLGAWLGIVIAGAAAGLQLGYSPLFPYGFAITLPVMVGWHAVLGIIEGVITALVVLYLAQRAPTLLTKGR
ncbi:MAG: energy-coupling factor ABC transporter permease [Candidatus Bathyarchaeia archaeon]